jgi:hypothetical protein
MIDLDVNSMYPTVIKRKLESVQVGGHNFNPNYWPYTKMVSWDQLFEAERWCYENLKGRHWKNQGMYFAFKRKDDYAFFILSWS